MKNEPANKVDQKIEFQAKSFEEMAIKTRLLTISKEKERSKMEEWSTN